MGLLINLTAYRKPQILTTEFAEEHGKDKRIKNACRQDAYNTQNRGMGVSPVCVRKND
jgi:hypothetical protein